MDSKTSPPVSSVLRVISHRIPRSSIRGRAVRSPKRSGRANGQGGDLASKARRSVLRNDPPMAWSRPIHATHRSVHGSAVNLALLLQLKRLPGGAIEAGQRKLYSKWPSFHYESTFSNGAARRVTPPLAHEGAQFAEVVFDPTTRATTAIDAVSATVPEFRRPLADALAGLIAGTTGRSFVDRADLGPRGVEADWDGVVWDLIDAAADPSYTWGAQGSGRTRGWQARQLLSFTTPSVPTLLRQTPFGPDAEEQWAERSQVPEDPGAAMADTATDDPISSPIPSLLHIEVASANPQR